MLQDSHSPGPSAIGLLRSPGGIGQSAGGRGSRPSGELEDILGGMLAGATCVPVHPLGVGVDARLSQQKGHQLHGSSSRTGGMEGRLREDVFL